MDKLGRKEVGRRIAIVKADHYDELKRKNLRKLEEREQLDCEEQRLFRKRQHARQLDSHIRYPMR